MSRRLSLAYLTVNGVALPEHVEVAAGCRYQSVGLRLLDNRDPSAEHWRDTDQIEETRERLDATGIESPVKQMDFLSTSERTWMAMEGLKSVLENAESAARS